MNYKHILNIVLASIIIPSCNNGINTKSDSIFNSDVYRPDSSEITKSIQARIDTVEWANIQHSDLGISLYIPNKWTRINPSYPVTSVYTDISNPSRFNPTFSVRILNELINLDNYYKYKTESSKEIGLLVEDNPNPYFWTSNIYTSYLLYPSTKTNNKALSSWSFAFIRRDNLIEINVLCDTSQTAEMDLLFKNIIN